MDPTTSGRRCRRRRSIASSKAADQAQSLADLPWFQVFDDPQLQALIREALANNLDLRTAVARVEEARARAGIAEVRILYPQVDGGASYNVRQASNTPDGRDRGEDTTHQSGSYGFQLSWEIDLFGRSGVQNEAAFAVMLATEQGRRGVAGDARRRRRDRPTSCCANSICGWTSRGGHWRSTTRRCTYFQNRLDGGVSNRLELDRALGRCARRPLRPFRTSSSRLPSSRTPCPSCSASRRSGIARDHCGSHALRRPRRFPPGLPASLLERRPDVLQAEQLLVAANADIGAAKALFYPTISLTGFLGGVSGDLTSFLGGDGAVWSLGAGLLQPIFQGGRLRRNLEAMQARLRRRRSP